MRTIHATYRLQFTPTFGFAEAAALAPLLAELGISHVYASPVFEAVAGSTHGYDVTDPGRVREALGGEAGWQALSDTLAAHGLGLVADIVPNHMALAGNPWWTDVLAHGPRSRYAHYFDLREPDDATTTVLIPLLAEPYGVELEAGRLTLVAEGGTLQLAYGRERLPLSPESLTPLLDGASGDAAAVAARLNGDREALHALLENQHYRLTWWRLARDETPYRRFFDINGLVGVRVEHDDVFDAVHALPLDWVRNGLVDGLRIDHVDGLADPAAYLRRLRAAAPDTYLLVEKILADGETLPDWPVDGTTGYEFAALVTRLLTAPEGVAPLTALHAQFTGSDTPFADTARDARDEMVTHWLLGDVQEVAALLYARCQAVVTLRDYSQRECLTLVQEIVAQLPVYRTYVDAGGATPRDTALLASIFDGIRRNRTDLPEPLVAFAAGLCLEPGDDLAFVSRLQQLTTVVAAKAIEDTAFYRDTRSIAHNEVGANPSHLATTPAEFLDTVGRWQAAQPRGLRTTSTHDTKRAEDVRARLTVLSEATAAWADQVAAWSTRAEAWRVDGQPDRQVEYYLFQSLAGAWPVSRERAQVHALKAAREAKLFTNWTTPSPAYEDVLRQFVDGLCADATFVQQMDAFVTALHPADWHKALTQVLLKITVPGVPDFYQGAHGWLLRMSDPDNREPVDYAALATGLDACAQLTPEAAAARLDDGLAKLWVTTRALQLRARHASLAPTASCAPLAVQGDEAASVIAFLRGDGVAVVAPIRTYRRAWGDTRVTLPPGSWTSVLSGATTAGGDCPVVDLWSPFPVALLERTNA